MKCFLALPVALLLAMACLGPAAAQVRIATDASGRNVHVDGSIVIVQPDIELLQVTSGGLQEPRREWSDSARRLFPAAVHALLDERHAAQKPDFVVPDGLDPTSRLGQVLRLNRAVALSIAQWSQSGSMLATKKDADGKPQMDWSLGPGVSALRDATGADYALFTRIRSLYASNGRAIRSGAGVFADGYDTGGEPVAVATLVDLRTGNVVWFNRIERQDGDLRDANGSRATAERMLGDIPL